LEGFNFLPYLFRSSLRKEQTRREHFAKLLDSLMV